MPRLDFTFDIPSSLKVWNLTALTEPKSYKEELTLAKEKEKEESFRERKKQHLASKLKDLQTDSEDEKHENGKRRISR